jgi:hypothetical protein
VSAIASPAPLGEPNRAASRAAEQTCSIAHFVAVASTDMCRILVNHAEFRLTPKRAPKLTLGLHYLAGLTIVGPAAPIAPS